MLDKGRAEQAPRRLAGAEPARRLEQVGGQGSLLWWSVDPKGRVEQYVEDNLEKFVSAIVGPRQPVRKAASKGRRA